MRAAVVKVRGRAHIHVLQDGQQRGGGLQQQRGQRGGHDERG
jgi:hypothetical protein